MGEAFYTKPGGPFEESCQQVQVKGLEYKFKTFLMLTQFGSQGPWTDR